MKIMENIKNEEKFSIALPVSIKCVWRENDAVNVLHNEHNVNIGAHFKGKLKINSMPIRTGNIEYNMSLKEVGIKSVIFTFWTPPPL